MRERTTKQVGYDFRVDSGKQRESELM